MKQTAGFILALTSTAPAIAGDAVNEARLVDSGAANTGLVALASANAEGVAAALDEGRALLMAGNAAQAISAFRLALTADQGSVPALNGLAIAYDRLGRRDLARRHFEMALALAPGAGDIAYNLGLSLHLGGEHRAAVPWLQRASGGEDGRAAAAARRLLVTIAARLEAEAAGTLAPSPAATDAPVRVATARIDMASTGEAVLVLPSEVRHPAARPTVVAPVATAALAGTAQEVPKPAPTPAPASTPAPAPTPAPALALSVPMDRVIMASLPAVTPDLSDLQIAPPRIDGSMAVAPDTAPVAMAAAEPAERATAPAPLPVQQVMASRLGALAALTIPLAAPAAASASAEPVPKLVVTRAASAPRQDAAPATTTLTSADAAPLPRVVTLADVETGAAFADRVALPATAAPPPLRLLDLAALPMLATATPLQPLPLLIPARIAVDWLAGTDIDTIAPADEAPAHERLIDALLVQADLANAVDPQAVRMAIGRLEALVARIRSLTAAVAVDVAAAVATGSETVDA